MVLLSSESLVKCRIIATGGKGGVGKTTTAAALALHFAENENLETLVISSDPTPSLSDIYEFQLDSKPTPIPHVSHLSGQEMSRDEIVRSWKERFGDEVYEVASSFLPVERDIIDYVADAPGIADDQYMLAYLLDIAESGKYDKIIWDTAPAGQTLSILKLESRFYEHLTQAANLYIRMRKNFESLGRKLRLRKKRSPLEIIEEWRELANNVLHTLRNPDMTEFVLVTIPEGLGLAQTRRVLIDLSQYGIRVNHLVINNVLPEEESIQKSPFLKARQAVQRPYLEKLEKLFDYNTTRVHMLPIEVKGLGALREIGQYLAGTAE
ncbi:MAG: ArsA family ATPase [Candidatus Hodarchaeota archaeon]